ncbi:hypothetical protein N9N28_06105 [Rubripirellula amarantea]|nr:hypothetical protein [Rubripirellula amarantea]
MSTHPRNTFWFLLIVSGLVFATGCERTEPITTYTIPTRAPAELREASQRMLAGMVPHGSDVWFFKVTGPEEAIELVAEDFRKFIETIQWDDDAPELSQLPEGWKLSGGESQFRYASINVETPSKQLDISVSKLGRQADWDAFVAMNVNRWRGQLGLPPSQDKWASAAALEVETADGDSVWLDIVGDASASSSSMMGSAMGSSMNAPFAGGAASRSQMPASVPPMLAQPDAADAPSEPDPRVKFERPEGWRDGRMSSMRMAAFNVGPEESPAEITVIPAGGDLRGNVARWIGQVRGSVAPDEVVDKAIQSAQLVTVDGREGQRFFLTAEDSSGGEDAVADSADAEGDNGADAEGEGEGDADAEVEVEDADTNADTDTDADADAESDMDTESAGADADATAIDATIIPLEGGMSLFIKMTGPRSTVEEQSSTIADFLASLKFNL